MAYALGWDVQQLFTKTIQRRVPYLASAVPMSPYRGRWGEWGEPHARGYVQLGSETIYAEISGAGRPLILIHGL